MQGQIVENQATLRRDLEAEKKLDKDVKVIISADQQIDYQEVSDLVDAIRKAGISNFALDVMRIN